MWLVKVSPILSDAHTRKLHTRASYEQYYNVIMHARKIEMRVSLSFLNETNTTLTNQLAVNHPQARNNLHTRAQSNTYVIHARGCANLSRLVSPPLLLVLLLNSRLRQDVVRRWDERSGRGRKTCVRARATEDNGIA